MSCTDTKMEKALSEKCGLFLETLLTISSKIKNSPKMSGECLMKKIDETINYIKKCQGDKIMCDCSKIVKKLCEFSQACDKKTKLQKLCETIDLVIKLIVSIFQAHKDLILDLISTIKSCIMPDILCNIKCSEKNRKENPNAINKIIECLLIEFTEYKNLNESQSRKDLVMKCVYTLCLTNYSVCALSRQKLKICSIEKCLEHFRKVMSNHGGLIKSAAANSKKIIFNKDCDKSTDEKPTLEKLQAVLVCVANTLIVISLCHCKPDISAMVTFALASVTEKSYAPIRKVLGPRSRH